MRAICRGKDMPREVTVRQWAAEDREGFYARYARARDIGLDVMADQAIEIADTPEIGAVETDKRDGQGNEYTEVRRGDMVEHRRLRFQARQWYLSKLAPKRYGDRLTHEHSGPEGGPIEIDERARAAKIEAILAAAARRKGSSDTE